MMSQGIEKGGMLFSAQLDVEVDMEDKEARGRNVLASEPDRRWREAHTKIMTVETHGRL